MATLIEPCPFCGSGHLHISHHLMSHAISCQSCRSRGPHRRDMEDALVEWNHTSRLMRQARNNKSEHVQGRLNELEDVVAKLSNELRHNMREREYDLQFEH